MKLFVLSVERDWTGLIDVSIVINNKKEYTFILSSQFDFEEFERLALHNPGKALNWLKQVKIKNEKL